MKKSVHERGFVEFLRAQSRLPGVSLCLGIGDDAAILRPRQGFETLLTSDLLVENVHFDLKTTPPWELGARAVAASLSDIAAMGGIPRAYLVSLAIPKRAGLKQAFFKSLYSGMRAWGESFGAELAGGDTSLSPGPLVIDIFMLGEIEKGRALLRSQARPGDHVFCTGTPGDSAAGLALLQGKIRKADKAVAAVLIKRHLLPVPRCVAGRFLSTTRTASACIDISDGVASELHHLARESGVAIDLYADALPISPALKALGKNPLPWVLSGGEDYELLFTVAPAKLRQLERDFFAKTQILCSPIGRVKRGRGVRINQGSTWKPLADSGYEHKIF